MPGSTFEFKQFKINQDRCAMKVGTDAVLIGSWTESGSSGTILDIGTGTGIIALMLAQKSEAQIDAIDIEESACIQARENVNSSPWKERINIHHTSLQDFTKSRQSKYDLIVSNPPYFIDSPKATGIERSISRHTDLLPFEELITCVLQLMKTSGKFFLILPVKEGELFRTMAAQYQLYLTRLLKVKGSEDQVTVKRLLMCFERTKKPLIESSMAIEKKKRHHYTAQYKELTKDYYLGF